MGPLVLQAVKVSRDSSEQQVQLVLQVRKACSEQLDRTELKATQDRQETKERLVQLGLRVPLDKQVNCVFRLSFTFSNLTAEWVAKPLAG